MKKHFWRKKISEYLVLALLAMEGLQPTMTAFAQTDATDAVAVSETAEPVEIPDVPFLPQSNENYEAIFNLLQPYSSRRVRTALPEKYSSVDLGWVTSVKNQGNFGCCWAFSTINALESSMLMQGWKKDEVDLSELHLAYFAYQQTEDPLGNSSNNYTESLAADSIYNTGGDPTQAVIQLSCWKGAAKEEVAPYRSNDPKITIPSEYAYQDEVILANAEIIAIGVTAADRERIKDGITRYGSLTCTYKHEASGYTSATGSDAERQDTTAFYNFTDSRDEVGDHAVSLVGWDDTFPKEYFNENEKNTEKKNLVQQDGAWLIKNSWGETWGNDGYFWISYEEPSIGKVVGMQCVPADTYDHNYHYDGSSAVSQYLVSAGNRAAAFYQIHGNPGGKEQLEAVNLFTCQAGGMYRLQIYEMAEGIDNGIENGNPVLNKPLLENEQTGTLETVGIRTIKLEKPVSLEQGKTYGVVFEASGTDSELSIGVDREDGKEAYAYHANPKYGQTMLYDADDGEWTDCADLGAILRIKLFTTDVPDDTQHYAVRVRVNDETGGIATSSNATTEMTAESYAPGDTVTLTAEPNEGWSFVGWTGLEDVELRNGTTTGDLEVTFRMPEREVTATAVFESESWSLLTVRGGTIQRVIVASESNPDGEISGEVGSGKATSAGSAQRRFESGTRVWIQATVPDEQVFREWQLEEGDAVLASPANASAVVTMGETDSIVTAICDPVRDVITGVTGLKLKRKPAKTSYKLTEEFNPTGLVVQVEGIASASNATYTYTLSEDEYELDTSAFDASVAGEYPIYIRYVFEKDEGEPQTVELSFTVEVLDEYPDDEETYVYAIQIKKKPVKQTYQMDEELDLTGLVVAARQRGVDSGNRKEDRILLPEEYDVDYDFSLAGTRKVTILYYEGGKDGDKTCRDSFTVKVLQTYPQSDYGSDDGDSGYDLAQGLNRKNPVTETGKKNVSSWIPLADGTWKYRKADGSYAASEWICELEQGQAVWYYIGSNGIMQTGWFKDPMDWHDYYLDPQTGKMLTGRQLIDGVWYHFNEASPEESGWHYDSTSSRWSYTGAESSPLGMWMDINF